MLEDKDFYNQSSSHKLGWRPEWFGCTEFDESLIFAIKAFQREHNMYADGLCGPGTFRRVYNQRIADAESFVHPVVKCKSQNTIVYNGNAFSIEWDKVVLWFEEGGLEAEGGAYSSYAGKPNRKIEMFVCHWDVCTSSQTCQKILNRRGISVTFLIGADGTVYQTCDMQHATWHAGGRVWNHTSTGVEINNAYYKKYQPWYTRHGFGERPIWNGEVHGRALGDYMGFYPVQIEALKALIKAVSNATGISLECPVKIDGSDVTGVFEPAKRNDFNGVVQHFHLKRSKIDCAGLSLSKILQEIKDGDA